MPLPPPRRLLRPTLIALALAGTFPGSRATPVAPAGAIASAPALRAAASEALVPYTVTPRDTLIGLNRTLFAEPGAWREVSRINHLPDSNRIAPGQVLMVPVRLLHSQVVPATLVSAFGDVRIAGKPAVAGTSVNVGDAIRTGDASTAVVLLADGSHVKLAPDTEGRLDEQRRFQIRATAAAIDDGLVATTLRLLSGSVEVLASKVLRAKPLEVATPTAVIGVRGTSYRVRNDVTPATAAASAVDVSATEVLEGKVHAQVGASAQQAADVPANFGAPLVPGKVPVVLPLPPAPDLSALPARLDHLPQRVRLGNGAALRMQVADDAAFDHIVQDVHVGAGRDAEIAGLAPGHWHLRARAISAEGLEGLDALRAFEVLATPQLPLLIEPAPGAKRSVGDVALHWAAGATAGTYRLEIARDAGFTQMAQPPVDVPGTQLVFHPLATDFGATDGVYFWRVAHVDATGTAAAWSDAQAFVLRPTPRAPLGRESPDGSAIELMWGGNPEDRVEVELARDAACEQVIERGEFAAPGGRLARPAAGTYYARYRFVEPDGFKTAWSDDVRIVVADNWHQAWRAWLAGWVQR